MKNLIVVVFVSFTAYALIASAQLPTTWTNPFFFYHYRTPISPPLQNVSTDGTEENDKQFSVDVDQIIPNTLESHVVLMSTCVRELKNTKADSAQTTQRLSETYTAVENVMKELTNVKARVENLTKKINERTSDIEDIGRMPTSCADLQRIGNKKNGFFSIMGQNKIQTVHCNFTKQQTDLNFQSLIGYLNVKSSPVYFYAQRTTDYNIVSTVIPFDIFKLNVGNAINSTGVFAAPRSGTYFFSFSALSVYGANGRVDLQMKNATSEWFKIGQALAPPNAETLTLQSTLQLAEGDQVRLFLREGGIIDIVNVPMYGPYTHFVGWLLEENTF